MRVDFDCKKKEEIVFSRRFVWLSLRLICWTSLKSHAFWQIKNIASDASTTLTLTFIR